MGNDKWHSSFTFFWETGQICPAFKKIIHLPDIFPYTQAAGNNQGYPPGRETQRRFVVIGPNLLGISGQVAQKSQVDFALFRNNSSLLPHNKYGL